MTFDNYLHLPAMTDKISDHSTADVADEFYYLFKVYT